MTTAVAWSMGATGFGVLLVRLARTVRRDGYGHRAAPGSRRDWSEWTGDEW